MPTIDINITGGTYKHPSLPLSAQVTRNLWPQIQDNPAVKSKYILQAFYGMRLFGTVADGVDRGMLEHKGVGYKVTGTTLYTVASDGTHTTLDTIPGTGRCIIVGINNSIVIVTEGNAYVWDGATLTQVTDPDLESPSSAAHLNNQIIYDGDEGRFVSSDVGDATDIPALNYATAESDADDLVRVYTYNQTLYLFGDKTIETWYNSGVGTPPFDRIENGITRIGLQALYSVANTRDAIYFLGDDHQVYALNGSSYKAVSNLAIATEIASYSTRSDAIGFTANIAGQWFYFLTFPTENKTWAYTEGGDWWEWSSNAGGGRSRANSYMYIFGKHLVADYESGNIYELTPDVYTENEETIIRLRDTGVIHGGLFGAPGKDIEMSRFELIMETGIGLITGQGVNPYVMLSYSDDGGRTFSTEQWATAGRQGAFQWKVEWFALGRFTNRIMRIRFSDPCPFSIHSAAADIEVCS